MKSPPEKNPICVPIHSAGLDMSKQHAFTTLATLYSSTLAKHWTLHTHESKFLTSDPTPSHKRRQKHFSSHTQNKTSWLFVTLEAKLQNQQLEIPTGENPVF